MSPHPDPPQTPPPNTHTVAVGLGPPPSGCSSWDGIGEGREELAHSSPAPCPLPPVVSVETSRGPGLHRHPTVSRHSPYFPAGVVSGGASKRFFRPSQPGRHAEPSGEARLHPPLPVDSEVPLPLASVEARSHPFRGVIYND